MRVRLSRPCIRWLRYTIAVVMVLLLAYGMTILSGGKMISSAEFDTSIIHINGFHGKDGDGLLAVQGNIQNSINDISNIVESLREDYDTEDDELNQLYAKVDKTLKVMKDTVNENVQSFDNKNEPNEPIDNVHNVKIDSDKDGMKQDSDSKVVSFDGVKDLNIKTQEIDESAESANIVISSYGINKSTVLDDLFQNKADVIVFDQPSFTLWPLWYLRGDNQVCSMKSSVCKLAGEDTSMTVMKCLIGLLRCVPEALEYCLSPSGSISHKKQ